MKLQNVIAQQEISLRTEVDKGGVMRTSPGFYLKHVLSNNSLYCSAWKGKMSFPGQRGTVLLSSVWKTGGNSCMIQDMSARPGTDKCRFLKKYNLGPQHKATDCLDVRTH